MTPLVKNVNALQVLAELVMKNFENRKTELDVEEQVITDLNA